MSIDLEKLRKDARYLHNSEEQKELLSDLNNLEASEKIALSLKSELNAMDAIQNQGRIFTITLMFVLAVIDGTYIYRTIVNGVYSYSGKVSGKIITFSLVNDPVTFWLWLSVYILVFIILIFTISYMLFRKPAIIARLL